MARKKKNPGRIPTAPVTVTKSLLSDAVITSLPGGREIVAFAPRKLDTPEDREFAVGPAVDLFPLSEINLDELSLCARTETAEERMSRKPDISYLEEAVAYPDSSTALPLFDTGDRIVIERYCHSLPGEPWLDTQTYTVEEIDDETGELRLWNADLNQHARGNFITGPVRGDVYMLAHAKGEIGKKKRGRPRKNPIGKPVAEKVKGAGRGRPPGSKNRPREVVQAEKRERERLRGEKEKARALKKALRGYK